MTEKITWNDQVKFIQPLKRQRNKDEALKILKNLAAAVKPIMKRYNWSVGLLKEFYPRNGNLLGLNVNHGQSICVRLRYAGNPDSFLPWHNVLGTMLHELVHIRISPHNAPFYKLLDQLYNEQEDDERNGLIQNAGIFEGKSYKVGRIKNLWGNQNQFQNYPPDRSILLKAAEKRQQQQQPDGRKVGGSYVKGAIRKPKRDVLADAAERRLRDELQCANNENYNVNNQIEIIEIEDNVEEDNNNKDNNQLIHNENNNNMGKLNGSGEDEKNRQFLSGRNVDGKNLTVFNGNSMEKFNQFGSSKEELEEQNQLFQIFNQKKSQTFNQGNSGDIDTLRNSKDNSNDNIVSQRNFKVENQDTVGSSSEMQNIQHKQWSCGSCTFLNHFEMVVCEMCEQPKQKKMRI